VQQGHTLLAPYIDITFVLDLRLVCCCFWCVSL